MPMDETTGGVAVGVREFNALYKVANRADWEMVAKCYEVHGIEVGVLTMTEGDRDTWAEWMGKQG